MKKIIVSLCVLMCLCFVNTINGIASITASLNGEVTGTIGSSIDNTIVTVTLTPESQCGFENLSEQDDVTDWFDYVPDGLLAKVYSIDNNVLSIEFTGVIDDGETEGEYDMSIHIPEGYITFGGTSYSFELDDSDYEYNGSKFVLYDASIELVYKDDYVVSGTVGEEINEQIIVVVINGPEELIFDGEITLSDYNGLHRVITDYDDVEMEMTITYTGIPTNEDHSLIETTISKEYLDTYTIDRLVTMNDNVKYDIVKKQEPQPVVPYVAPVTGID